MPDPTRRDAPPTIDMTLDGDVLAPPSRWTVLRHFWQALPRGAVPALLLGMVAVLAGLVILFGLALLVLPVLLLLGAVGVVARLASPRRQV